MKDLWKLFRLFFKIGLFTFGGGYAMLPLLKSEVVTKRRFITEEELLNLYSISQCTPGIIAVNVATFIGYNQQGIKGAIATTLGIIAPSLIIIMSIAGILNQFMSNVYVAHAFSGIRICVAALIADIIYDLGKKNLQTWQNVITFILALLLLVIGNISASCLVIISGLFALSLGEIKRRIKK